MRTVDKAIELLGYFSEAQPEFGLSELSRTTGFDKATTHRLLLALIKHDYIEQSASTKNYRIGSGVLRLAKVREINTPLEVIYKPLLSELVTNTGETAHFSIFSGGKISTIAVVECTKAVRIHFYLGEEAAIHATASGIVALAFSNQQRIDKVLKNKLESFTEKTITDRVEFLSLLDTVSKQGYFINQGMYEQDICSIAAPVFNQAFVPIGAIAVSLPSLRFTTESQTNILHWVLKAAANASKALGAKA